MKGFSAQNLILWVVLATLVALLALQVQRSEASLGQPTAITGYLLIAIILALALFNMRKRLSMVPLGRASTWLLFHGMAGVLAIAVYWLHTGTLWPLGLYEQAIAVLFYLVSVTGIVGYVMQRIYPARLTHTGLEVIYERIPAELARLRTRAEEIVVACTNETTSDTLARHYFESFAWYFRRPRFTVSYLFGGNRGMHWVRHQRITVGRYLNDTERGFLDELTELSYTKTRLDMHYAMQSAMKAWLLLHVPLSAALVLLSLWHMILVHIYAL